jgi:hypothetical protein
MDGDSKQAIVCFRLPIFCLLSIDDADNPYFNQATDVGRGVPPTPT